jgi:Resolvase, N terminal domain
MGACTANIRVRGQSGHWLSLHSPAAFSSFRSATAFGHDVAAASHATYCRSPLGMTRSLSDFARIVEIFDKRNVSFVSVTQQFNTTTSMGRLTLNILLSFAQFEREVTGERNMLVVIPGMG